MAQFVPPRKRARTCKWYCVIRKRKPGVAGRKYCHLSHRDAVREADRLRRGGMRVKIVCESYKSRWG